MIGRAVEKFASGIPGAAHGSAFGRRDDRSRDGRQSINSRERTGRIGRAKGSGPRAGGSRNPSPAATTTGEACRNSAHLRTARRRYWCRLWFGQPFAQPHDIVAGFGQHRPQQSILMLQRPDALLAMAFGLSHTEIVNPCARPRHRGIETNQTSLLAWTHRIAPNFAGGVSGSRSCGSQSSTLAMFLFVAVTNFK
jgi:hypothetical protein